ncbi:MAG TPA: hypothetical protein VGI42_05140 [Chthoniobacterales bacterium]|jgi:hypothetical protein
MNASSEKTRRPGTPLISGEAVIGIGVTIGALGFLSLLLGCAEYLRSVPAVSRVWLSLGTLLFIIGAVIVAAGWAISRRR